jgi:RNA polymerase sigma-70 factor (ECF subfamily)
MRSPNWRVVALVGSLALCHIVVAAGTRVEIQQTGIDAKQAESIQKTLAAAASAYANVFGFDVPDVLHCSVKVAPGQPARLYTDGNDHVFLSLPSADKLARPQRSGVWNLYGMCHELGHGAMYRVLKDRDWLSGAGAEGWAHYAGSVVVDRVYAVEGEKLWWDPYDYRADGTARLNKQLEAGKSADETVRAAESWQALAKIIGEKEFPRVFAAWQAAKIDPAKPEAVLTTLERLYPAKKAELAAWWASAGTLLVEKREASGFAKVQAKPAELSGKVTVLAGDDGKPDGKKSIAGSGHARVFAAPGPGRWYLRAVSVYGARYGRPQGPKRDFDLALCDKDLRPVASWKIPYSKFKYGREEWVRIEVEPTLVPEAFAVCVTFQPTATEGVFVSFDSSTSGHSLTGTPGKAGAEFKQGDWMIRVELDQLKSADALGGR